MLRNLFLLGAPVFFSFGLWNVLLLPMAIRELGATEFEYGAPGGPDVGRVRGRARLFMAKYAGPAPDGPVGVHRHPRHGHLRRVLRALPHDRDRDHLGHAVGLLQLALGGRPADAAPAPHAARAAGPRVLGDCSSCATSSSSSGMAGAGLADIVDVRIMIIARVADPVRRGRRRPVRPGHRAAGGRMAAWRSPPCGRHGPAGSPRAPIAARPATVGDFDAPRRPRGDVRAPQRRPADGVPRRMPPCARSRPGPRASPKGTRRRPRTSSSRARRRPASRTPRAAIAACRR